MNNIKSIFSKNKDEIELVKFIARFQYLSIKDVQYFFDSTYYPKRITKLVQNNILRRYKKYLVLAENGKYFVQTLGQEATQLRYDKKYTERLKFISHLAVIYRKEAFVKFIPSFEIKDKNIFTETSRKYIGILKIFGTSYLTYHIAKEHTQKYINSVIYDLQKESNYKNIIVLIDNINRINFSDFIFGFNSLIVCEDTDEQLKKLAYIQQINWQKAVQNLYNNVHISEYNFCDYTNNKNKYISTFYMLDTEKINRINMFLKNNENKKIDIISSEEESLILRKLLLQVNYNTINLSEFIDRNVRIYD